MEVTTGRSSILNDGGELRALAMYIVMLPAHLDHRFLVHGLLHGLRNHRLYFLENNSIYSKLKGAKHIKQRNKNLLYKGEELQGKLIPFLTRKEQGTKQTKNGNKKSFYNSS